MADRNAPASFTFEEWRVEFNELAVDVGDIANLPSTVNGNAVTDVIEAISELEGALSSVMFPTVIDFDDSTGPASERIKFGDDDDLQIYHDGTNSRIDNTTGELQLSADLFKVQNAAANETMILGTADGSVDLYYDNDVKMSTTNTGIAINNSITDLSGGMTGSLTFPSVGGNIAVEGFAIALAVALG